MPKRAHATPALDLLTSRGVTFRLHEFESGTDDFGLVAAAQLTHLDTSQVFKTLVAAETGTKNLAIAVIPVDHRLSPKKLASAWGVKSCDLADPHLAQLKTGYIPGGITGIATKVSLPVFLDETAILFDAIAVSAGRRGLDVELAPDDYVAVTGATYCDLLA